MNVIRRNNTMKDSFHDAGCNGSGVVLALIDTGVNAESQWLKGRVAFGDDVILDKGDHGTSVAGIMSEYAPEATILSYNVFPDGRNGNPKLINAALADVLYRKQNDPERFYIVNLSLGVDIGSSFLSPNYSKMHSLIQELVINNVPVVCAAGNDGQEKLYAYPACWQEPICVAAIDSFGKKANFSSFLNEMDFADIGVDVRVALSDGGIGYKSGTSFSSPTVAGKIALIASMVKNNTGEWPTEPQVYELLKKYAIDISDNGFDPYAGFGFVYSNDVEDAFHEANNNESPISVLEQIVQFIQYIIGLFSNNVYASDLNVSYTRQMSLWSYGADVKAVKDKLVELGYLAKSTHDKFYKDTQAAVKKYQSDNGLKVDGIVGMLTWNSLFGSSETGSVSSTQWTRNLSKGMSGDDCKALKDRLVDLGYLYASTKKTLGSDSDRAIRAFQSANGIEPNGTVDLETWNAIFSDSATIPEIVDVDVSEIPPNIGSYAAKQIAEALKGVSDVRKAIVLDALRFAVDPDNLPEYMYSFYGRGKNLYEKDLSLCIATKSAMRSYFNNANYAPYYDGGRQEIMEAAALESNYTNSWADCSGAIVGETRNHCSSYGYNGTKKLSVYGFDANANTLYSRYCTATSNPKPADWAWKEGHIGLVAGAGYSIEWVGGAYGCQLTKIADRRVYSFLDGKRHKMGSWSGFGKPVFYD